MIIPPPNIHVLIPGTCEFVTLNGKGGFGNVIKIMNLNRKAAWIIHVGLNYPMGP